jgi:hypothetical protein
MSRDITPTVSNALTDKVIEPFFAIDLVLDSSPVYIWSGYGNLVIGSKTYIGAGAILNISAISETTEMDAKGATISLSGIPSSFLSLALQEPYQGRECIIYFGMTSNPSAYVEVFSGELDQMNIDEAADTATISVSAENVLVKLERPIIRRFSDQDQKSRFPNDKGLEFVASLQDKEILWGRVAK